MKKVLSILMAVSLISAPTVFASSHREAPAILSSPQVDGTDFYMFRSYEEGREGFVTLIANYNPLQDPYGGPNYFPLDSNAVYDIHVTNNGDVREDLTFRFQFKQTSPFASLLVGDNGNTQDVAIPLSNAGPFGADSEDNLNVQRSYSVKVIHGKPRYRQQGRSIRNAHTSEKTFAMPFDNIGNKSIPDYEAYAENFIYDIDIPHCKEDGRMFVGQRKESFAVNLGEVFDLVNTNPVGDPSGEASDTEDKNITTLALEIPIDCLTQGKGDVLAAWTTSSLPQHHIRKYKPSYKQPNRQFGNLIQVSRLANPLANEVVIGLPDKNLFNASHPRNDAQFLKYVTHPTLPELLEILFGVQAPDSFPRADLVQVFLTGVPGLNEDGSVGEMMRLNTAIAPTSKDDQSNLGVLGGDVAGYPNGRRPGDDVVDISLRAVMGVLLDASVAPDGQLPYTDGAAQNAGMFDDAFPYLTTPIPGSPN